LIYLILFLKKHYKFDYRISTDCVGLSIQLIHNDFVEKEKIKKQNMKQKKCIISSGGV